MSHEIYYTSAPEGIKRGSSGFCTVGATENIPRALWERLEALSAYRHHEGAGAGDSGANPVSWAHWLLNVAGIRYHVLSRVSDSGVDHTQRTNAFAHHLVVDAAEMAAGGPAWMLQHGVMVESWNGQVGTIARRASLPRGDAAPGICRGWAQAAGDAGWGGALAESVLKGNGRPVCILFSPEQDVLGLVAEALRLLPARQRWNVTFNTYFTSMPTSATCLWRCCLKGTPAADIGLRYAANGLVLDLTDRGSLGAPAESDYVKLARTGTMSAALRAAHSSTGGAAAAKTTAPVSRGPAAVTAARSAPVEQPVESGGEIPFADEAEAEPAGRADDRESPVAAPPIAQPALVVPEGDIPVARPARKSSFLPAKTLAETMREAEATLSRNMDIEVGAAKKRRRQAMLLYLGAILALAIGMTLMWIVFHGMGPRDQSSNPLPPQRNPANVGPKIAVTPEVIPTPPTNTVATNTPPTNTNITPPPPMDNGTGNVTQAPLNPAPHVIPVAAPKTIVLRTALLRMKPGSGIGDKSQTIPVPAGEFADLKGITGLSMTLQGAQTEIRYKLESLSGTLAAAQETRQGNPGVALKWTDASDLTGPIEVAYVSLNRGKASVELSWKMAVALKRPELPTVVYWAVQNSFLTAEMGSKMGQRIEFKPLELKAINLKEATSALGLPAAVPNEAIVTPLGALPTGWTVTWYTDWEVKDAALRTAENASQVLKFRKGTSAPGVEAWFLVTFRPGWATVESTMGKRQGADETELARAESDLRSVNSEIARIDRESGGKVAAPDSLQQQAAAGKTAIAGYKEAIAGYNDLTNVEVALDLPDGMRIAIIHFRADGK